MESIRSKLASLASVVGKGQRALILSHNNLDPDAIASALLLKVLLARRFQVKAKLACGGVVGRAENKALMDYAKVEFLRLADVKARDYEWVALVDTQPGSGNNSAALYGRVLLVFDHHRLRSQTRSVPFYDVRSRTGATVTLIYQYIEAAGIALHPRLATAIVYALRSETSDFRREASSLDMEVYKELYPQADQAALSSIANAKVGPEYFASIRRGIEKAVLYGDVIITLLGELPYPDVVAEVAEYFLRYRRVSVSMSAGFYQGEYLFSIRSDERKARLGLLAQKLVKGMGTAGGHGTVAGGQIRMDRMGAEERRAAEKVFIKRFLMMFKADKRKPKKLSALIDDRGRLARGSIP